MESEGSLVKHGSIQIWKETSQLHGTLHFNSTTAFLPNFQESPTRLIISNLLDSTTH